MSTEARRFRKATPPAEADHEKLAEDRPQEEAQKSYHTVLEQHLQQAQEDIERPTGGLFLSSISAGLDLGFGPLLMAVIATQASGELSSAPKELLLAAAYTVGFVFVVMGRSALFTEQTTSAVLPVLARRASFGQLLRLWGIVLIGNVSGGAAIAAIIAQLGPNMGIIEMKALAEIAAKLLEHPWWVMLLSAVAAGWLMGLLAWLVVAGRDTVSQIVAIVLTTFVIGLASFHHSIAGTIEVLMAVFAGAGPTPGDYGVFILWAALGNALGGAIFVALLKFGHVRASSEGSQPPKR